MSDCKNVSGTFSANLRPAPSSDDDGNLPFPAEPGTAGVRQRHDISIGLPPELPNEHWTELLKNGRAVLYRNGNWKDDVYVVFSSPGEFRPFLPEVVDGSRFDPERAGGLACGVPGLKRGRCRQLLWVRETTDAMRALEVLVHEAIHAASFALAARGIPLDLRDDAAGDCLAFFVEDLLAETLPFFERKLGIQGADLPRKGTRKDKLAIRGGKGSTLKAMKKLGVAVEHEDRTWRSWITAVVCNADDADPMFNFIVEPDAAGMDEDTGRVWYGSSSSHALVWADGSRGARAAYASLAHGAIHAAGSILANCGADVDVAKTGSSESVAYFVQYFFENIRPWFLSRFAATLRVPGPAAAG